MQFREAARTQRSVEKKCQNTYTFFYCTIFPHLAYSMSRMQCNDTYLDSKWIFPKYFFLVREAPQSAPQKTAIFINASPWQMYFDLGKAGSSTPIYYIIVSEVRLNDIIYSVISSPSYLFKFHT